MITLRHRAGLAFFNTQELIKRLRSGWRRRAIRWGSWVRLAARHSMRWRRRPSPPGQPPHAWVGLLREHIYFAWEPGFGWGNVVVGPIALPRLPGSVPRLHEYGGRVRYSKDGKIETAVYPPRPFMRPAASYAHDKFWQTYRQVWT